MIPPSPAYTVATPAVFVITTSRKFARLHMISFTGSARSGLLQCREKEWVMTAGKVENAGQLRLIEEK